MGHPAYDEAARILTKSEDQRRLSQLGMFITKLQRDASSHIPAFVKNKTPLVQEFNTKIQHLFRYQQNIVNDLTCHPVHPVPEQITRPFGYSASTTTISN